ncbi:unnamed protein product [Allacma fusca]|uniref:Uncharacterized protein n=1 Tax=Allacma fusca TaxID=39272 RepID=A0A8J2LI88_9HEXA|nr:unnamed protein product [Allacma fusca]
MKTIFIVFLTVLAVEYAYSFTSSDCFEDVEEEWASLRRSEEHCADNARFYEDRCEARCVFNHQGATSNGVLTPESFCKLVRRRVHPQIFSVILGISNKCFRDLPDGTESMQ